MQSAIEESQGWYGDGTWTNTATLLSFTVMVHSPSQGPPSYELEQRDAATPREYVDPNVGIIYLCSLPHF